MIRIYELPSNKRMQSDLTKRYALASAADARRYMPCQKTTR